MGLGRIPTGRWATALALALAAGGCSGDGGDADAADPGVEDVAPADTADTAEGEDAAVDPDAAPDADVGPLAPPGPWVVSNPAAASAAEPWQVQEPQQFRTTAQLGDLDVTAVSAAHGHVWVGTASGLYRYDPSAVAFVAADVEGFPAAGVADIAPRPGLDGRLPVLREDGSLWLLDTASGATEPAAALFAEGLAAIATDGGELWLGGPDGLVMGGAGGEVTAAVRDIDAVAGAAWVAAEDGLYRVEAGAATLVHAGDARAVRVLDGQVWAGTAAGLVHVAADGAVTEHLAGLEGLPFDDVVAVAAGGDQVLLGHTIGATSLTVSGAGAIAEINHHTGLRWLPAVDVRAVDVAADGGLWIGTGGGVTRVDRVLHTFDTKAEHFEITLDQHFWRMDGFVAADLVTDDAWEPSVWTLHDKDNDGLWTQMQIGAWCYAYAATGDPVFYDRARKAMDAMFLLIDVPAADFEAAGLGRGFVARSLVRDDEGALFEDKIPQENWHLVHHVDGHDYYWKDDTSSDETTGHFFGYPLFYDLCAQDDAERAAVAEHAAALARTIVEHGYLLLDLDGEATTHGHWNPERLASAVDGLDQCDAPIEWCADAYFGGGWLNAVEILGHLLAAWHMTGDPYFYDAYDELVTTWRYDEVATPHELTVTITEPAMMNHSDHELAMLAYHTLIRYEPDPERRALWIEGLRFLADWEAPERNPLWAGFVAVLAGAEHVDVAAALTSLREMPLDQRGLLIDNSHRKDATPWPDDRHGDAQFDRVFPYDEIRVVWWNGNFHVMTSGGDGRSVEGPMAWLLPYRLLRYAGVIGE